MRLITCLLEGGPFHGDIGRIEGYDQPPEYLYAWQCTGYGCAGDDDECWSDGIHWAGEAANANPDAEIYQHHERDEGRVEIYVWTDIDGVIERFLAEAPEPALA